MSLAILWSVLFAQAPYAPYGNQVVGAAAAIAVPAPALPTQPETSHAFLFDYDTNRDGVLSINEVPERLRGAFTRTDTDGNGRLDAREILTGSTRISREARRLEGLRVNKRDLERGNGSGQYEQVIFRVPSTLLQRLDQNRDGYADARELGTLLQQPGIIFGDPPYSMTPADVRAMAENQARPAAPSAAVVPATPYSTPVPAINQPYAATMPMPATPPFTERPTPTVGSIPSPFNPQSSPAVAANNASPFVPSLVPMPSQQLPARPDAAEAIADRSTEPAAAAPAPKKAAPALASTPPAQGSGMGPDGMPDAPTILKHLDKNGNGQLDRSEAVDQLADNFDRLDRNRDGMLSEQEIKKGLFLAKMFGIKPKQDPRAYRAQKPEGDTN